MSDVGTKRTRVLLLHNFLSPYRIPLFEALARRFDLDVWIMGDIRAVRDWPAEAPGAAFRVRALPCVTVPLGSRYNVILLNYSLPRELKRLRPEVIVCCGWDTPAAFYASYYARRTNTPFVLWSGSTPAESTWLRSITKPFVRALVRGADAWIAYGSRAKEYLISLGAEGARCLIAYNTVDWREFAGAIAGIDREAQRARLGITTKYVALYCGNLLDLKGVGELMEAFGILHGQTRTDTDDHGHNDEGEREAKRVAKPEAKRGGKRGRAYRSGCNSETVDGAKDITLVLVGSGKHEAKYRERARELGIDRRVVFAGFVPRETMPSFYAIGDVLILPSRSEVWGLVINEALACGVPVIASDACGAAPDLITDGENGFIVPARDPAALANAIASFFSRPDRHAAMRAAARDSIAPFTIDLAADAFVEAVRCAQGKP